jgi:hypothetical protein
LDVRRTFSLVEKKCATSQAILVPSRQHSNEVRRTYANGEGQRSRKMDKTAKPKVRLLSQAKALADLPPGQMEAGHLQEQFSGPVPLRGERPAAELLRERMAEAGSIPQVFVP